MTSAATFGSLLALAAGAAPPPVDPLAGIDEQLARMVAEWEVPGAAVGVVHEGRLVYARGFGVRELGRPEPVDADTLFLAGSTTKAVTAFAVGLLVQDGVMGWDDPLAAHLPGLALNDPTATREVTVRDALSHRTGYGTGFGAWLYTGSNHSALEAVRLLRHLPRPLPHRATFGYNNLVYAAVGEAVAARSGLAFDDFLRIRLWEPLGMTRTFTRHADWIGQANRFTPHTARGGPLRVIPGLSLDTTGGAGFVVTSVNDYAKWVALLLDDGGRILRPDLVRELLSPTLALGDGARAAGFMPETATYAYGLGWFVGDFRGTPAKFHRGSWFGGMAAVGMLPERDLGVIVLENRDAHSFVNAVVYSVFERFQPGAAPVDFSAQFLAVGSRRTASTEAPPPAAEFPEANRPPGWPPGDYAGRYTSAAYGGGAEITVAGETLRLACAAHPGFVLTLRHRHGEVFAVESEPPLFAGSRLRFRADERGAIEGFDFAPSMDRHAYRFNREQP